MVHAESTDYDSVYEDRSEDQLDSRENYSVEVRNDSVYMSKYDEEEKDKIR